VRNGGELGVVEPGENGGAVRHPHERHEVEPPFPKLLKLAMGRVPARNIGR
jgi:hypothetical protein